MNFTYKSKITEWRTWKAWKNALLSLSGSYIINSVSAFLIEKEVLKLVNKIYEHLLM